MLSFNNILYAIDLDDERITSIFFALEFAQFFKSRLHILYVNDRQAGYRHPADREDAIALKVKGAVPEALLENMDIIYASAKGNIAEEIVNYTQKHRIDLIMAGHQHRSKLFSSVTDSADINIIDATLLPVFVIPES